MPTGLTVRTPTLEIGYEAHGDASSFPVVLLHGFPDDVRAWDAVAPPLVEAGYRVLVPYLRGYGPTRFRDAAAPRMAEQAAIGQDVIDFADALRRAVLKITPRGTCRYLWKTWSPSWHFNDETFNRTAASFDNPDFVDVVI